MDIPDGYCDAELFRDHRQLYTDHQNDNTGRNPATLNHDLESHSTCNRDGDFPGNSPGVVPDPPVRISHSSVSADHAAFRSGARLDTGRPSGIHPRHDPGASNCAAALVLVHSRSLPDKLAAAQVVAPRTLQS